jgi:short-subunit dehydrogenase
MDQATKKGISPEQCARTIVRAVERDRDEILVGGKEVFAVALRRFFPALFHRLMRRARVT